MNLNIRRTIRLFSLLAVLIPSPCLGFLEEDEEIIKSPTAGVIRSIAVVPGQHVKRGDLLYIVDVMKMYVGIIATRAGFIGALYFTLDQRIEEDMSLITILPFMPVEEEGDPMDTYELPLSTFQSQKPSIKDHSQNNLGEVTYSPAGVIASEAKQSIGNEGTSASGGGLGKLNKICKIPLRLDHEVIKSRGKHGIPKIVPLGMGL